MQLRTWILAGVGAVLLASCQTKEFTTSDSGLEYKFHSTNQGTKAKEGDYVKALLVVKDHRDSVVFGQEGEPQFFKVTPPTFKGDLMEGIMMMSEGDSATFLVSTDSLRKSVNLPPDVPNGVKISYNLKVLDIMNEQEFSQVRNEQRKSQVSGQMAMVQAMRQQMAQQDSAKTASEITVIQNHLKKNNQTAQRTPSGVFYVIERQGSGEQAAPGKMVKVHYTGTLLNGQKFDSSLDRGEPFEFLLGVGDVIPGWDDGIAMFSEGAKGKLFIPSTLAYRDQDRPGIPANSVLVFDVELLEVNDL